ncbi:MAG: hypothetical protein ABI548_08260 [Polyangiaceae bacterium]
MARALWFLALLSAFFVVAVRCLSGAPASAPCAIATDSAEARSSSPDEDEPLASADLDDDSDDSADPLPALAAPPATRLVTFTDTQGTGLECGALVALRALPSHAASLDRPPRA